MPWLLEQHPLGNLLRTVLTKEVQHRTADTAAISEQWHALPWDTLPPLRDDQAETVALTAAQDSATPDSPTPRYSRWLTVLVMLGIILGSLDGLSRAFDIVSLPVAVVGSGLLALTWIGRFLFRKRIRQPLPHIQFAGVLLALWLPFGLPPMTEGWKSLHAGSGDKQTLFPAEDSTQFNVLILRFEDLADPEGYNCIGLSLQDHLGVVTSNTELPLEIQAIYADSIAPPKTAWEAEAIQQQHHADLVLYGLANNAAPD
ncbi:MAG TPA: hypothetical protein DCP28_09025, partial [Cytophagales bacterium]|nr:hypothetical protein [Cytophagales bacterium]